MSEAAEKSRGNLLDGLEDPAPNEIVTRKTHQEEAFEIVSESFPQAKVFLKERLADSIQQRQARLSSWRQEHREAKPSERAVGASKEAKQSDKCTESNESSTRSVESMRWNTGGDLPKAPKIEHSQKHFVCQICFLPTPPEEAKGDLWM